MSIDNNKENTFVLQPNCLHFFPEESIHGRAERITQELRKQPKSFRKHLERNAKNKLQDIERQKTPF